MNYEIRIHFFYSVAETGFHSKGHSSLFWKKGQGAAAHLHLKRHNNNNNNNVIRGVPD